MLAGRTSSHGRYAFILRRQNEWIVCEVSGCIRGEGGGYGGEASSVGAAASGAGSSSSGSVVYEGRFYHIHTHTQAIGMLSEKGKGRRRRRG
jgi:hypothetical protein